jgi:hypothetical protein
MSLVLNGENYLLGPEITESLIWKIKEMQANNFMMTFAYHSSLLILCNTQNN